MSCSLSLSQKVRRWLTRRRQPGQRKTNRAASNRVRPRLDECERLELPGSFWNVGCAFVDVAVAQPAEQPALIGLGPSFEAGLDRLKPALQTASNGDTTVEAGYNIGQVDSAFWEGYTTQSAAENRPAMTPVFSFETAPADKESDTDTRPLFANLFVLPEFADQLTGELGPADASGVSLPEMFAALAA